MAKFVTAALQKELEVSESGSSGGREEGGGREREEEGRRDKGRECYIERPIC